MSRRRSVPSLARAMQTADDLLAGRLPVTADELLACIHAVNPTGRSLGSAEERRRYELKADLQSLLVRTFHDELEVSADEHGVVAIRHRYLGQDACHARIDELEAEARARVRWMLDVGAGDGDPASDALAGPTGARDVADADDASLAQGRAALAEFDYDAARAHFERAVAESADPEPARALLELLVDHLGLDADALACEGRLAGRATSDAEVRRLLGLAAARTGDAAQVERLLDGLAGSRVADAWRALADQAAGRSASDDLERYLARLSQADPAHPELVRLRAAATHLRADARRPAEQELLQIAEAGDDVATEAAARRLLARWPDSPTAGRLLARIQDRRRAHDASRLVTAARAALREGQLDRAAELCRRARAAGADTAELMERVRAAELARRAAHDQAELAAVCARLGEADLRPGLAGFVMLEPDLRRQVRDRAGLPVLDWLEHVMARHKRGRAGGGSGTVAGSAQGAIIEAVLAIPAAAEAIERGDAEAALAILAPHEPLLVGVARARELAAEAARKLAAWRHAAATAALDQAELALAGRELTRCDRVCDGLDPRELDADQRARLERVRRASRARRDAAQHLARVDQLASSGDLVGARHGLEAVLAAVSADAAQTATVRARLGELRAAIRIAWRVHVEAEPRQAPHDRLGELLGALPYVDRPIPCLTEGGREIVLAHAEGPHVVIARVSLDRGALLGRIYLRAPAPLGELIATTLDGDTLWLVGEAGWLLQVSWTTGEPVRWLSLAPLMDPGERIERVFQLPGGSHLWLETSSLGGPLVERVIEIDPLRPRREIPRSRSVHPVIAGDSSFVLGTGLDGGAVRYSDRGALVEEIAACAHLRVSGAAIAPDRGLVVVGSLPDDEQEDQDEGELAILRIRSGRVIHRRALPDSSGELAHCCGLARGPGLFAVHHRAQRDDARLTMFRVADPELVPAYTVAAPPHFVLAQDIEATQLAGIWDSARGVETAILGDAPPVLGDAVLPRARWLAPQLGVHFSCGPFDSDARDAGPLLAADGAARRRDWHEVRTLLESVSLDDVHPSWRAHHCHLLGVACLRTGGEPARVRELWQAGHPQELVSDRYFPCRLDVCLELVEPLPDPLPDAWWGSEASLVRQLRGAIAMADRRLATGEPAAALQAMRRRAVTAAHELQSTARLAAAWLAVDPSSDDERFDKAIALARYAVLAAAHPLDLPIQGAWREDRLTALAQEAAQWLAAWPDGT